MDAIMKRLLILFVVLSVLFCTGCGLSTQKFEIVATTLPVYDFAVMLCDGTGLSVGRLISENVSCLHDYTLKVDQMMMIESADVVLLSGLGLEDFLEDALNSASVTIDASINTHTHEGGHSHEDDHHAEHDHSHKHVHETDPHIWLSPENAMIMVRNLAHGLSETYPEHKETITENLTALLEKLQQLQSYGNATLADLSCRELITFHDGFSYFAESFDLSILEAVEEESGSEASASMIIHLTELVNNHNLPAIFIETNGSDACAGIISAETDTAICVLDMAMSGDSYFEAMYHNIDTIKEALG